MSDEPSPATASGGLPGERRRHPRRPLRPPLVCRLLSSSGGLAGIALALDISAGGVGLLLTRPAAARALAAAEVENPPGVFRGRLRLEASAPRAEPGGGWILGCAFPGAIPDDELRRLLA